MTALNSMAGSGKYPYFNAIFNPPQPNVSGIRNITAKVIADTKASSSLIPTRIPLPSMRRPEDGEKVSLKP